MTGWLPCDTLTRHDPHLWTYTDPATRLPVTAWCDGTTRPEAEGPCCGDGLCPCGGYVGNYHGATQESR